MKFQHGVSQKVTITKVARKLRQNSRKNIFEIHAPQLPLPGDATEEMLGCPTVSSGRIDFVTKTL